MTKLFVEWEVLISAGTNFHLLKIIFIHIAFIANDKRAFLNDSMKNISVKHDKTFGSMGVAESLDGLKQGLI